MRNLFIRYTFVLIAIILLLSCFSFLLNHLYYHFPGNNYFPENAATAFILLLFFYFGLVVYFGKSSKASYIGKELLYFFAVMSVIALATNAVQLTPFIPIDRYILSFENWLHIDLESMMKWTNRHPQLKVLLISIYNSLPYQMALIPLFVIALGRVKRIKEYYFLLLSTVLVGFLIYYFFPTTAPASVLNNALFDNSQIATGLKFNQIHHHISPTTNDGGLIALPSFHVIWAILCVYLLSEWLLPCIVLAITNSILIASCVLLGWHYPIDVVAGVLILGLCYYLMLRCEPKG